MNGYKELGDDRVGSVANSAREHFAREGTIDPELQLTELRGCLFFEQRRFRHFGHDPTEDDVPYIRALVEAIRTTLPA